MEPTRDDPARPLDELLEPGTTIMVGTISDEDRWEFRPLTVAGLEGDVIDILLDTRETWVQAFVDGDVVEVTLSDDRKNNWASVRGMATISYDQSLIDALWSPFAGAYFDEGRNTPGIAVFRLRARSGRYWSAPSGRIGSLVSIVSAALGRNGAGNAHGDIAL